MSLFPVFWLRKLFRSELPNNPNAKDPRHVLGELGEKAALKHLKHEGYRIRAVNYRTKKGEIDIIAQEKGVIVFVEVRTLSSEQYGDAFSTVNEPKRRRLTRTAHHYLDKYKLGEMEWRFDFVSVIIGKDEIPRVELIRDAFQPA